MLQHSIQYRMSRKAEQTDLILPVCNTIPAACLIVTIKEVNNGSRYCRGQDQGKRVNYKLLTFFLYVLYLTSGSLCSISLCQRMGLSDTCLILGIITDKQSFTWCSKDWCDCFLNVLDYQELPVNCYLNPFCDYISDFFYHFLVQFCGVVGSMWTVLWNYLKTKWIFELFVMVCC